MASIPYAELHCHTNFSFLDGASSADDLVARGIEIGLTGLAVTDHQGLYGVVRFATAALEAGLHPVIGIEIELLDPAAPDPLGVVGPRRRRPRGGARAGETTGGWARETSGWARETSGGRAGGAPGSEAPDAALSAPAPGLATDGLPARPRPARALPPGHRDVVREDLRGIGERQRGPHLVLLARDASGYRSLCRLVSRANLAGTKGVPRFSQTLLAEHAEGLVALSGCRDGEIARRLRVGDRAGARTVAERYARTFGAAAGRAGATSPGIPATSSGVSAGGPIGAAGFVLELGHHLLPDDDWVLAETVALATETGLPVVVTNDVHYARVEDREMQDVLVAIRHGRTLETLRDLRRPDGESYLKSGADLARLTGLEDLGPAVAHVWSEGIANAAELAAACSVDLGFERYRFPGFPVPDGETPFSVLEGLCHEGARKRYHPITPAVVRQLAHELDVVERTGLAEFFLICWDLMRFARERGIPAQGRGSAADSIVAYVLGITRVDPIRHRLLFERFINEGRTTYPDVDIDFSSERREEVIQYVYERYGPEHTGMVCNVVTYRARSAVREIGYALGFPRPLVDRVAKALETYDSVMVRRDLEAEGGFARFFARPGDPGAGDPEASEADLLAAAGTAGERGLVDGMGQLNHARGGRIPAVPLVRDGPDAGTGALVRDGSGTLPGTGSAPAIRSGGRSDDEGGPGDSPASVRWLRERARDRDGEPARARARARDGERARARDGDVPGGRTDLFRDGGASAGSASPRDAAGRAAPASSVARVEPAPAVEARRGSTRGMSDWDRWLEFCARIDGFPRHLSIHSGGMLVTAAPLIDIAPLERATMADRVVIQYDKRDVETLKLIKLDLLGLGMLAAIDETLRLIESDCGVCVDLDRLPEDIPEVFEMLRAADTVGVFQVESRAQMQTLPKSRPKDLDDLVVEVAIIRPGPIQGNAVHPYLRRKQGLEPVTYLHPNLEPILGDTLGVILYQEQVMQIAIEVAGFSAAESDGFRRAMGTWRSTREMEKLHARFVGGCRSVSGMAEEDAEELFRRVAAFASFGFAKSHAAAFARTAYESAFLKLFYPAQFVVGLVNAQPMGFYPVEVLVNDAKRHGVSVLPVDVNASSYRTTTEWVGAEGPLPPGAGIDARPTAVRSPACVVPGPEARSRWAAESATAMGVRLGLHLVKGIGEEHAERLDAQLARGPYRSLADVVERTGLSEEVVERLIRAGALDSLGRPRRELLWQLREVAGATKGRVGGRATAAGRVSRRAAGRPMDLRLPATPAPELPPLGEVERLGDAYAVLSLDARRQVVGLFREALDRLGAIPNSALAEHRPGRVRIGGLVVTRQHPMTARGTVFLALEDETGMVNVTLWPDAWARLRGVVRRNALLLVDGTLQREADVVNVIARDVLPLPEATAPAGGPARPAGVRHMGMSGMRRA